MACSRKPRWARWFLRVAPPRRPALYDSRSTGNGQPRRHVARHHSARPLRFDDDLSGNYRLHHVDRPLCLRAVDVGLPDAVGGLQRRHRRPRADTHPVQSISDRRRQCARHRQCPRGELFDEPDGSAGHVLRQSARVELAHHAVAVDGRGIDGGTKRLLRRVRAISQRRLQSDHASRNLSPGSAQAAGGRQTAALHTTTAGGGTRIGLPESDACGADFCDAGTGTGHAWTYWAQGFGAVSRFDANPTFGSSRSISPRAARRASTSSSIATTSSALPSAPRPRASPWPMPQVPARRTPSFSASMAATPAGRPMSMPPSPTATAASPPALVGTGTISEQDNGSFDGSQYGGQVEGGWRFAVDNHTVYAVCPARRPGPAPEWLRRDRARYRHRSAGQHRSRRPATDHRIGAFDDWRSIQHLVARRRRCRRPDAEGQAGLGARIRHRTHLDLRPFPCCPAPPSRSTARRPPRMRSSWASASTSISTRRSACSPSSTAISPQMRAPTVAAVASGCSGDAGMS